jgi:hypothetical protein
MAKEKRYYYECVTNCQMGYIAPSGRREEFGEDGVPTMVLHERDFQRSEGRRKADYLCTTSPLSRRYTEEIPRNFPKKNLRTGEIINVEAHTIVKFVLLDPEDVGDYVREHTRFMTLRDIDLAVSDKELVGVK